MVNNLTRFLTGSNTESKSVPAVTTATGDGPDMVVHDEVIVGIVQRYMERRIMHLRGTTYENNPHDEMVKTITNWIFNTRWMLIAVQDNIDILWTEIRQHQHLLDFVYNGLVEMRLLVAANQTQWDAIVEHVSESLALIRTSALKEDQVFELMGGADDFREAFENNPWLIFLFYLSRGSVERLIVNK